MILEITIVLASIAIYLLYRVKVAQTYYKDLGIPTPLMTFPLGNSMFLNMDIFLQRKNVVDISMEQCKAIPSDAKIYGVYLFGLHAITICDAELCKQVMVKSFDHFVDRCYTLICLGIPSIAIQSTNSIPFWLGNIKITHLPLTFICQQS